MAALWILALVLATYFITIMVIYVGQEVHVLAGAALLAICGFGAFKLFQRRLTRL
ncbi:MAG: hypothetical protein RIR53_1927 [Bacteroidota bacterium]|jgi:hypothetical protein